MHVLHHARSAYTVHILHVHRGCTPITTKYAFVFRRITYSLVHVQLDMRCITNSIKNAHATLKQAPTAVHAKGAADGTVQLIQTCTDMPALQLCLMYLSSRRLYDERPFTSTLVYSARCHNSLLAIQMRISCFYSFATDAIGAAASVGPRFTRTHTHTHTHTHHNNFCMCPTFLCIRPRSKCCHACH